MPSMEKNKLVTDLLDFLKTEPACLETLGCLNAKAEIQVRIAQSINIKVIYDGKQVIAEEKGPLAPDFVFDASPDAIAVLIAEKGLSSGELGIKFVKQLLSRDVKVSMPSSIFQVTRKGYFKILTLGGTEFFTEMKKHNLASLPKISAALNKIRKSS